MPKRVAAKVIERAGTDRLETQTEVSEKRVARTVRRSNVLLTMPERLANDKFAYVNWRIPNAETVFPSDWRLRFVQFYYPFAEGGPMAFDLPKTTSEVADCMIKSRALKQLGLRYVYITSEMTEADALDQLEGRGTDYGLDHRPQ